MTDAVISAEIVNYYCYRQGQVFFTGWPQYYHWLISFRSYWRIRPCHHAYKSDLQSCRDNSINLQELGGIQWHLGCVQVTLNYIVILPIKVLNMHLQAASLHQCIDWHFLLNAIVYWLININSSIFRFGRLHFNSLGLCPIVMLSIIEFWQIDDLLLGL